MSPPSVGPQGAPEAAAPTPAAILVVDDNRANLVALQAILEPLGRPLIMAASGEEALRYLLQRDVALILLDVQMPGMNGFELASLIKSHARLASVPIIFVTAISRDASHVFTGYAHGAVDYLLKPVDPEMLRAKVRVFVELYTTQQTIRSQAALLHAHELREIERRNEERFRGLTESMPLPVWGVQSDGRVHACNRAWTEYSGLSAEDTGAITDPRWMHAADLERARSVWSAARREGAPFDLECRLRRQRDQTYRWHLLRAVPEPGARTGDGYWIVAGVDIDAQKVAEDERARILEREQRAREQAEAANRMKDEFLATVSHELRTPLNAILSWARMVRTGMLDAARVSHAIETIERNAQFQAKLINDLLDISRIVSGKLFLQVGWLELGKVVADALDTVRAAAQSRSIDLRWAPPPADIHMIGDASRLQQVVANLASNSVKFTPAGGSIEVRAGTEGGDAVIIVEDTGRGISGDFLPYVFDRFRQEDPSLSREHDGLGLGLAIVKHLVELHGGRTIAESEGVGRGTRITVRIPTDGRAASRKGAPDPVVLRAHVESARTGVAALPRLDGTTVLFVDDQPEARELVSIVLGQCGARVVTVETAERAMRALGVCIPDILISDVGLPDEDGYALIRRVRALPPSAGGNVPAIALTAYARPEDQRRAKDEGFQVHMAKPVEPDELVSLVASLVHAPASSAPATPPAARAS